MRVLKKASLLAIVLLTALLASFVVTDNVAFAEEPPKITDHVYDPGNKLGTQADKVKERLASLDRSGLHVYVAFPSEYSNDTVSNWNLMALQKSGAPQGSYMLSIVADNPNQTMYLASADNAAKLSQNELSAIASEKMVPLLNQQKYPEAVLAYLDALSTKAPEMGSGLAVAPWAMIAFLVALIVVIIVISRVLRARRQAQNRVGEKTKDKTATLEESASPVPAGLVTEPSAASDSGTLAGAEVPILSPTKEDKRSEGEDEQPAKGKFRLRFGRKETGKAKPKSPQEQADKPDFAPTGLEGLETTSTAAPVSAAPIATARPAIPAASPAPAGAETPKADLPGTVPATLTGIADTSPAPAVGGKVPSLAELDQIALARSAAGASANAAGGYQAAGITPQTQQSIPQEKPAPPQTAQAPAQAASQAQPVQPQPPQPGQPAAFASQPPSSPVQMPAQIPAVSPQADITSASPAASSPLAPSALAAPASQGHSSVLRPGETTYLPPQANDDDTQVTSASQIKDYGQERRDEIARAKARAQAAARFRAEQANKQDLNRPSTEAPSPVSVSPLPASASKTVTPEVRGQVGLPSLPQMAPSAQVQEPYSLPPVSPQAIPQVSKQVSAAASPAAASPLASVPPAGVPESSSRAPLPERTPAPSAPTPTPAATPSSPVPSHERVSAAPIPSSAPAQTAPVDRTPAQPQPPAATPETSRPMQPQGQPDFTKVLRQADSWARKGASKLALAQQRVGKTLTQPFALALVHAQDSVRAAFAEFATAQLQSRPIDQQIVAGNLPAPLRELRDQITHFTNLYHQQTPLNEITDRFQREIVECREELVRCRLLVERIQNDDPQKATRIGSDVMAAHKLLSRAQNLIEDAQNMERAGQENEVLKATVRTENLLLQARKIVRQAHAEEAALQAAAKVKAALTFAEKVEPLSEQVAILMAAVDDYIGVHTAKVGVAARTMLDLANRTLTRLDRPGNIDTQEALRLLQRAQQQTEQALRLAENDVAKRS